MGSFYKKNKHIKNRLTNRITFNFPLSTFNSICRSTERQIGIWWGNGRSCCRSRLGNCGGQQLFLSYWVWK